MNLSMNTSKDNLLMTTLVAAGFLMATLGPALASQETRAVMDSAGRLLQAVTATTATTANEPVLYPEAAIIVAAPRLYSIACPPHCLTAARPSRESKPASTARPVAVMRPGLFLPA
jgi:hypothetical protein